MKAAMNNKGSTAVYKRFRRYIYAGLISALCSIASHQTYGQGNVFEVVQGEQALTEKQAHYLDVLVKDESTADYRTVIVNPEAIEERSVTLDVFDKRYTAFNYNTERRGPRNYSWFGRTEDPASSLVFVVNGDMVTGFFTLDYQRFMLYPLGEGLHVLLEMDMSSFPSDENREAYAELEKTAGKPILDKVGHDPGSDASEVGGARSDNCSIRYLIAYTTAVNSALADVHSFIQGCVDDHNAVNNLSNGQHRVELARSVRVAYTESGSHQTDRNRFRITNDGFMDEIHDLRSLYDADVCQLINNTATSGCGIAAAIGASYSTSFAVTQRSCAIGNHTFTHETGHLYGARHDTYADNTNTPFAYGHGFVNAGTTSATRWRTVMAYNDECEDSGFNCTRLGRWSNPLLSVGGTATGTFTTENNARVVREEESTLAAFEPKENFKSVYASDIVLNREQGHFEGTSRVTGPGGAATELTYNNGSIGSLRANEVVLTEGFWARTGSDFVAYIGDCTDAPALAPAAFDATADETNEAENPEQPQQLLAETASQSASLVRVIPNPFRDHAVLLLELAKDARTSITLYDMLGKPVIQVQAATQTPAGSHQYQLPVGNLAGGIYILHVQAGDERLVERIVKQN